jgi:cellulose biosynthesis protein BcsQ
VSRPFVVTIASEKGGVGKTTIATNLAVYLKALQEDLPVTIASFDNHFSVDQMFALGARPEKGVAELLTDEDTGELASLGQYGVQYLASAKRLRPPEHPPVWLRQRLYHAVQDGILILDTRPILDWFTEAALLAADVALAPVKDRAALVNASSLRQVLIEEDRAEHLWLLPSLVDSRAKLNADVRVHEFLAYAAKERDYQVLDIQISKSPKVEGLASGFSSTIKPVLTHARNTAVHGQLKELAEFVLQRFDSHDERKTLSAEGKTANTAFRHRVVVTCPVCGESSQTMTGSMFFHLGSRRRGLVHEKCMTSLCERLAVDEDNTGEMLALTISGPGLVDPDVHLVRHICDEDGRSVNSEEIFLDGRDDLQQMLKAMTGRSLNEAYRELIVVSSAVMSSSTPDDQKAYRCFMESRRKITRELRESGLF